MAPNLESLTSAIRASWSADSAVRASANTHPSAGQCAVSSLIVQDYLGGELLRSIVAGESHYWNRLPDGTEVDVSRDQFDSFESELPPSARDREYVLSFPDTRRRYLLLRAKVEERLAGLMGRSA